MALDIPESEKKLIWGPKTLKQLKKKSDSRGGRPIGIHGGSGLSEIKRTNAQLARRG